MISLLRVDDRLIHGQTAVVWTKYLGVSRIIVANDKVSTNDSQKMALSLAVPEGIKAFFKNIVDTQKILNDPRASKMKILVIVNSPQDALKLIDGLETNVDSVNLGNYGRVNNMAGIKKQQLADNIFVTDDDITILKKLKDKVPDVFIQSVPNSTKKQV